MARRLRRGHCVLWSGQVLAALSPPSYQTTNQICCSHYVKSVAKLRY
jgi:hypothetical protein